MIHKMMSCCVAGLSLGGGLVIFASVLSDAYMDRPRRQTVTSFSSGSNMSNPFDYRYGWSFFAAGAAFIMAEVAALLSMTAYLRRFPTVEDMVRVMVPGAERRLRQGSAGEYLVHHSSGGRRRQNGPPSLWSGSSMDYYGAKSEALVASDLEGVEGPLLLSNTAPDICTTNPTSVIKEPVIDNGCNAPTSVLVSTSDTTLPSGKPPTTDTIAAMNEYDTPLAGVTVPITLMRQQPLITTKPTTATDTVPVPMPTPFLFAQQLQRFGGTTPGTLVHQGVLGVSEGGASTSSSSSGGTTTGSSHSSISKYSTLPIQHKRKNVTISTFSTMESAGGGTWSNSEV
ncbi:hypothetical protein C0J52_12131 [Blattella germanica]|nr:hypothetical protein C0J52_12131 [Blattella germanica]